ncbi:hypothetical protein JCM14469_00250 [Desulfatiferula olefinivorans]
MSVHRPWRSVCVRVSVSAELTDHGLARTFTDKHGRGSFGAAFEGPPSVSVHRPCLSTVRGGPCLSVCVRVSVLS